MERPTGRTGGECLLEEGVASRRRSSLSSYCILKCVIVGEGVYLVSDAAVRTYLAYICYFHCCSPLELHFYHNEPLAAGCFGLCKHHLITSPPPVSPTKALLQEVFLTNVFLLAYNTRYRVQWRHTASQNQTTNVVHRLWTTSRSRQGDLDYVVVGGKLAQNWCELGMVGWQIQVGKSILLP